MFNFSDKFQDLRSAIIGMVLLLASIIMGIVWIGIGLNHWLTDCLGVVWGPIVLGLIFFLPVVIFALVKAFGRSNIPTPVAPNNEYTDAAAVSISKMFEGLSGHSPFLSVTVAVVVGFVASRFPSVLPAFAQILSAYAEDAKARAARVAAEQADAENKNDSTL